MEEENLTKKMLDEQIHKCLEELKNLKKGTDEHNKLVNDIQKLTQLYLDIEKSEFDQRIEETKFFENVREKDLEFHYKDSLERDKLNEEKAKGIRDTCVNIVKLLLVGGGSIALGFLALKLEFVDNGSVCSFTTKELLKKASSIIKSV